jgi:hypothetical protein
MLDRPKPGDRYLAVGSRGRSPEPSDTTTSEQQAESSRRLSRPVTARCAHRIASIEEVGTAEMSSRPRKRCRALAVGMCVLSGVLFGQSATASAANQRSLPKVIACAGLGAAKVRPATFILACADVNSYIGHISWKSWGARSAHGHGTLETNNCQPNCATGSFAASPTTITLKKPIATNHGLLFSVAVVGSTPYELIFKTRPATAGG